ncbi:hypothetical protein G6R29_00155 [Fructobacillus sp. M2-14]|uniref:Integral membrane protein n=1 Tax=Fructobacillus broussonetiae TaxID=2713173 RepID=A0ABS5QXY0_9LACO|nr:hypothetical protein [Fructobacillus broussonetiae]MBS9338050.1 hypothetical protein [Fructobacillus broussonetiae]
MSTSPIRLVPLKIAGHKQEVYYDLESHTYFQAKEKKKLEGFDLALFITFIISAVWATPYWILRFLPLPKMHITSPVVWWLGLFVSAILPFFFWVMTFRKQAKEPVNFFDLAKFNPNDQERRYLKAKWAFERGWIIFVLVLLPPTTVLFFFLYLVKANFLDALLLTLHGTLFLRRLQPDVFSRLKLSARSLS